MTGQELPLTDDRFQVAYSTYRSADPEKVRKSSGGLSVNAGKLSVGAQGRVVVQLTRNF